MKGGLRNCSAVKSIHCFPEDLSLVLSTYVRQLTTAYFSRSGESDTVFWSSSVPTHTCTCTQVFCKDFGSQ